MLLDFDILSHTESFIQIDEVMSATCLGWSDLTKEERIKILYRGIVVKDVEMGEWHRVGEDYVYWARGMFRETGLCFSKAHYDYVFSSTYAEDIFQKVANNKVKTIFQYDSSGRADEIEELLVHLRRLRMKRFNKDNTPELITVMYYIELTDKEKELLVALQNLGFPNTL